MTEQNKSLKLLAICSGGGHWNELYRLKPAFDGCNVIWCSTHEDYAVIISSFKNPNGQPQEYYTVMEANRWKKKAMLKQAFQVFQLVLKTRPDVVVSTGASVGFFGLLFSKIIFRSRTIWVQSLADAENMSMSGTMVRPFATLWLTQWEEQAKPKGPHYFGSVL